jgi:WD40 repeat protein/energy-coupling factor transporter ATP-binding protein EcfA2
LATARVDFDVFLSHKSSDKLAVEEIGRRLEGGGVHCWLDKWNLVPGEPWQEAIEDALGRSAACIVFLGPSGIGPWENEEMRVALTRRVAEGRSGPGGRPGFRVIPVLLPGAPADAEVPPFLGRLTWVRFGSSLDDEDAFHRLLQGIRGMAPGAGPDAALVPESPYRGLEVFDVHHAPLFFGREVWIDRLLQKIEESKRRFLAIVGPSGSGKSSLARAGVLAALQHGHIDASSDWLQVICRPGAEPLLNLALALNRERSAADSYLGVRNLARDLVEDPSALHVAVRLALREAPEGSRLVLLIDQFEEIFTNRVEEEERRALLDSLYHAATVKDGPTLVIIILRAEFYGQFADHSVAELLSEHHVLLGPMTPDEFRRAIEMPALRAGCELEPGLTDLLLRDVEGQPGSLPLLQYALLELWEQRRGRRLTVETYRNIGGVAGALRRRAEQVQETFSAEEREVICRRLLLLLAQPDEREGYSRRRARRDEVLAVVGDHAQAETVLNKLADARLVVTESIEGESFVEIAHEALIREWPRLRGWIDERREELILRSELGEAAERWADRGRDSSYLFTGARLAASEERSGEMGLGALEKKFLEASLAAQQEEHRRELAQAEALRQEQEKRANEEKRRRKLVLLAGIVAVLAAVLGTSWFLAQRQVRIQEILARARNLSAQSGLLLEEFPQRALLLAREAVRLAEEAGQVHFPPAEEALRRALAVPWGYPLQGAGRSRTAISADRQLLITASEDGMIRLWNLNHLETVNRPVDLFSGPKKKAMTLVVSPSKRWLAALYEDNQLYVWDLRKPQNSGNPSRVQLTKTPEIVFHSRENVGFSSGDEWIATWSSGESIRLWRPETPQKVYWLGNQLTHVITADFGGDDWLAAGYIDGRLELWNLTEKPGQKPRLRLSPVAAGQLGRVAFRQATSKTLWLLASDKSGPKIVWDSQGKITERIQLQGCADAATGVGFSSLTVSPRSRWLAYQNNDLTLCLFDLNKPRNSPILKKNMLAGATFQSNDKHLVVADENGVEIWNLDLPTTNPIKAFEDRSFYSIDNSTKLALDDSGDRLAFSFGRFLRLAFWREGIRFRVFISRMGREENPRVFHFSPGGNWLVTGGLHDVPRIFDVSSGFGVTEPFYIAPTYRFSGRGGMHWSRGGRWLLSKQALFDLDNPTQHQLLGNTPDRRETNLLTISPDGKWIAEAGTATKVRNLKPGKQVSWDAGYSYFHHPKTSSTLAFNSDASWLAVATPGSIQILDTLGPGHRVLRQFQTDDITAIAVSPDDRWLAAYGTKLFLWDLASRTPEPFKFGANGESGIPRLLFSPSPDQRLAAFFKEEKTLHLYSLSSDKPIQLETREEVTALAFSNDGSWLATSSRGVISLLDFKNTTAVPRTFVGHIGDVEALALSPYFQWMASSGQDNTIRLWSLAPQDSVATGIILTEETNGAFEWLDFRSNWLFGAKGIQAARWDLRMDCLKALACRVAGRSLTREEWRSATGLDEPAPNTCSQPLPKEEAAKCADVLAPYGG